VHRHRLGQDLTTVMRGFSDAYGSWKMICMCRRMLRSARAAVAISWPLNCTDPPVGSIRRSTSRPVVALAAAGFAHQIVDRAHLAHGAAG
jgi:hypothetical protein